MGETIDLKQAEQLAEMVDTIKKGVVDTAKNLSALAQNFEKAGKSAGVILDNVEKIDEAERGVRRGAKNIELAFNGISDQLSHAEGNINEMIDAVRLLHAQGKITSAQFMDQISKLKDLKDKNDEILAMGGPFDEGKLKTQQQHLENMGKEFKDINKSLGKAKNRFDVAEGISEASDMLDIFGQGMSSVFSGSQKGLRLAGKAAYNMQEGLMKAGGDLAKMPGLAGKLGGALKGLSGIAGGISKIFLGWPMIIATAAIGAVKAIADMDQYIKNLNKRVARFRGPNIMTKDVKGQFEQFNKLLFDTAKNLQIGFNAQQVSEFVESVTSAGLHFDKLGNNLGNYRNAVYVAAKASRILGQDIQEIGPKMADSMLEFRMSLDNVDDLFVQVAFNAQKAGVSTERFWGAIENATVSLMFYGNFLEATGKTLAAITKTQMLGAKDSADMVNDMTGAFGKMDDAQRAAFLDLTKNATGAKGTINKMFKEVEDRFRKEAEGVKVDIDLLQKRKDQGENVGDKIDSLREKLASLQTKANNAAYAQNKRSTAQAPYLPMLSDNMAELSTLFVQGIGEIGSWGNVQGENLIMLKKVFSQMGISSDLAEKMANIARQMDQKMLDTVGIGDMGLKNEKSLINQIGALSKGDPQSTAIKDKMDELVSLSGTGTDEAIVKAQEDLIEAMTEQGNFTQENAEQLAQILAVSEGGESKIAQAIKDAMAQDKSTDELRKKSTDELRKVLETQLKNEKIGDKLFSKNGNLQIATQQAMEKSADETFAEITKQTLSAKEMYDIAKDDVNYRLKQLSQLTNISGFTKDILSVVAGEAGVTPDSIRAANDDLLDSLGNKFGIVVKDKAGMMDRATQARMTSGLLKEKEKAEKVRSTETLYASSLGGAKSKSTATGLDSQIKTLKKSITGLTMTKNEKGELVAKTPQEMGKLTPEEQKTLQIQTEVLARLTEIRTKNAALIEEAKNTDAELASLNKLDKKDAKTTERIAKLNKKKQDLDLKMQGILSEQQSTAEADAKSAAETVTKTTDQLKQLYTMNETNRNIEKWTELSAMSNPDIRRAVLQQAEEIAEESGGGDAAFTRALKGILPSKSSAKILMASDEAKQAMGKKKHGKRQAMVERMDDWREGYTPGASGAPVSQDHAGVEADDTITYRDVLDDGIVKLKKGEKIVAGDYFKNIKITPNIAPSITTPPVPKGIPPVAPISAGVVALKKDESIVGPSFFDKFKSTFNKAVPTTPSIAPISGESIVGPSFFDKFKSTFNKAVPTTPSIAPISGESIVGPSFFDKFKSTFNKAVPTTPSITPSITTPPVPKGIPPVTPSITTPPVPKGIPPVATAPTGPTAVTININVNGTGKRDQELAAMIKNEVRGINYKEALAGVAS